MCTGALCLYNLLVMRAHYLLVAAALPALAVSTGPTIEQRLQSAREAIDAHATMRHFEPPTRSRGTKWHVDRIDGCHMELRQTAHRQSPDSRLSPGRHIGTTE